ncbi:bone morphogenetic protein 3 isoform X2 [Periophthalmus magnuspinnatus]|uniref:bone morphogenetic protein 3 isoform X2 n=1 Tax=Periophthalmus magnuspinnatus TaxID=409849 RepID=UPI002436D2CF|nr:bone morphogenetic protein 3 isoform X2 [Periophthalmus magnuspinnatus]
MASCCRLALLLFYAWSHSGSCANLRADHRRRLDVKHGAKDLSGAHLSGAHLSGAHLSGAHLSGAHLSGAHLSVPDTLTEHMHTLYAKYARAGYTFKDGNTVRSFKAHWGFLGGRQVLTFNLTSLTLSEAVLSATLHFYTGHLPRTRRQVPLDVWSFGSDHVHALDHTHALGHVRFDVWAGREGVWQWRDITSAINQAKGRGQLLVGVELSSHRPPPYPPYILVFANDSAISDPDSLQRHHLPTADNAAHRHNSTKTPPPRHRRSVNLLSPLHNNELPEGDYPRQEHQGRNYPRQKHHRQEHQRQEYSGRDYPRQEQAGSDYPKHKVQKWEEPMTKPARRAKKKSSASGTQKGALLQFDERTLKKARRKWAEPRSCARRHLKVDFADIGWNDWIISPKSYDAFYCAGTCHFPMAKALKPSNHATIQSIVRAVGVVPGIPEPCCVPEKMSALSILFFDEQANVVLKVYPNMSVETCACR